MGRDVQLGLVNLVGRAGEVVRLGEAAWMQLKPGHGGHLHCEMEAARGAGQLPGVSSLHPRAVHQG